MNVATKMAQSQRYRIRVSSFISEYVLVVQSSALCAASVIQWCVNHSQFILKHFSPPHRIQRLDGLWSDWNRMQRSRIDASDNELMPRAYIPTWLVIRAACDRLSVHDGNARSVR